MPRYHFDIRRGRTLIEDRVGQELPTLTAALEEATSQAIEVMDFEPEFSPADQLVLVRKDGEFIMSLSFEQARWRASQRR